ncbi:hypothetical protein OOK41_13675 [Micromonospora sp. NBC_01655]|uniref:hypothetical protein n=1 Tax=Micromonospora sp. NBC_01655 TaxID=2975983 RepID=UPI002254B833|nr:hypothetical protein [Micromonospora sp. NBC_01655]MCX4471344.1 hypothetical protein [Micromonospora sp. NBC_01655]
MSKIAKRIVLLILTLIPAGFAVIVTVEAIRTGRFTLGTGGAADSIPDSFYAAESFLPAGILDNAGWVVAACIAWIVVVALLAGITSLRRASMRRGN